MKHLKNSIIQLIFLVTPLVYAWLYIPGMSPNLGDMLSRVFPVLQLSGFESVKVGCFLLLAFLAVVAYMADYVSEGKYEFSQYFFLGFLIFFVWSSSSYFLNSGTNPYFLRGTPEKTHGWYFFLALFSFYWLVAGASQHAKKRFLDFALYGLLGVMVYAFFQKIGLDPLEKLYATRIDLERLFSTLGNPNYLAGYLLMFLPLALARDWKCGKWNRYIMFLLWLIFGILIYWTGSYFAWITFAGYTAYLLVHFILPQKVQRLFFWSIFGLLSVVVLFYLYQKYGSDILQVQKAKGFIARWYLWQTGLGALGHDLFHFLFGYGPDGFLAVSEKFRHPLLSVYEDPNYRIDSSHNFFIDFAIQFGVPMFCILLWSVSQIWKKMSHAARRSLVLFSVYFFFNIPVISHYIIVTLLLARTKDEDVH